VPLTDGDRIRNLLGSYCRLIDAGDFDGVGRLMARATLCTEDGTAIATGAEEAAALYRGMVRIHDDGTPRTQHLVLNTVFDEPAADGTVVAHSTYVVLQQVEDGPLQPIVTGRYVDTFARDLRGEWHFTERRFTIGLSGDLGRHLLG
jgi:ketosteroid isomerase-like protein